MYKRITEVAQGGENRYPIGTSASNITLNDGSILEEALGDINLAENGSIIDQINNMAQSYSQIYAPIISPNFQGSINLKEGSNTVVSITPKTGNQAVDASIQGDLLVSGVSNLGTIKNTNWSGDLPITGILTSIGEKVEDNLVVPSGIRIINSGIGFSLQDLSPNFTRSDVQNINNTIRTSQFSIHPGYGTDASNTPKLYYRSNGIHSFMIGTDGTGTEVATINRTGLDVNGKITCDSLQCSEVMKKVQILTKKQLVDVLTDYSTYPSYTPYFVRLGPDITTYLRNNNSGFTGIGFMWKSGSSDKPSIYFFYYSTTGTYFSSHVQCERYNTNKYRRFTINTKAISPTSFWTTPSPQANPAP